MAATKGRLNSFLATHANFHHWGGISSEFDQRNLTHGGNFGNFYCLEERTKGYLFQTSPSFRSVAKKLISMLQFIND